MARTKTRPLAAREVLLERAAALVPRLAERAETTERLRRIPDETVAELRAEGLLRAATPARFGGVGEDYGLALAVATELARGCGSTGWCYAVWSSHQWLVGLYPLRVQEAFFRDSPQVLSSSAFNPSRGRGEEVAGGYLLRGRWDFSSGAWQGEWALLAGTTPDQGPGLFLVPRGDYEVLDTWYVAGLAGTGSCDVRIRQPVFVPRERFLAYEVLREGRAPGRLIHPHPSYWAPFYAVFAMTLVAPLLGMAAAALEALLEGAGPGGGAALHAAVGEASARIDAARVLFWHDYAEMTAKGAVRSPFTPLERVRYRRDQAFMVHLVKEAVARLVDAAPPPLLRGGRMERTYRDLHAGSHQIALIWHTYAEQYGRVALGYEPTDHSV
jgi:alkylation response protein AidB-like acyl-CoA dehydrogenase